MATTLENISVLERRLDISLPAAEIDHEVQNRLQRLARDTKMRGFRPGKVPVKVIARQYQDQVRREVVGDALKKNLIEVVRERNLRVAGYPRFEPKPGAESASHVEFSATFEVYPEVSVGDIGALTIARPQVTIGDEDVDRTLAIMRKQRASFETVERAAAMGDKVVIDFVGRTAGVEFEGGRGEDAGILLGEARFLKDFESQLVGLKAGDSKTFEIRFPDDYHGKEIAGKTATFDVKLKQVADAKLPPLDAEFAKSLGVADGDLDTMRKEVRENLEREAKRRVDTRVKNQIMQALIESTAVEAPKALVEAEIERMGSAAQQDREARGVKGDTTPLPRELFEQQAKRRVTLGLILAELVKRHGLHAKPEQVRAVVEEQAQTYEQPQQVVQWFYQAPERLGDVESLVLENNVVAWVLATAKVEDRPMAFEVLMENSR